MDWFTTAFHKASLAWLALGVTLGLAMALHPGWVIYRPAHLHMNLLGFVTMMIFGVAYHVIPRFTGHALHSRRMAAWHWWLSNVGLLLLAGGMAGVARVGRPLVPVLAAGGVLSALGAYAFVYNIWRTIDGTAASRRTAGAGGGIRLPLAGASGR
jgi:cbb3-type cytochrome oxidase subunit 1